MLTMVQLKVNKEKDRSKLNTFVLLLFRMSPGCGHRDTNGIKLLHGKDQGVDQDGGREH